MSSSVVEQVGICMNAQRAAPRPAKLCCFCWCCCCTCSWCRPRHEGAGSRRFAPHPGSILKGVRHFDSSKSNCTHLAVKDRQEDGKSKHSDSDQQSCINEPLPSLDEVKSWGKSFDKLMKSKAGRNVFREFLRCEYSEENILFWVACEELKNEENPELIEEKARFIYEDYISILSPREVSLDSRVRDIVNKNMGSPNAATFDEAQHQIYTLMHRDSYPRFINSHLYKKMLQMCTTNESEECTGSYNNSSSNT